MLKNMLSEYLREQMKHENYGYVEDGSLKYTSILPDDLIYELLLYFSYEALLCLRSSIFNKYITQKFWIKRLVMKTLLPKQIFTEMIEKLDAKKALKFIYILNFIVGDTDCNSNIDEQSLVVYRDICNLYLQWGSTDALIYFKQRNISFSLKHTGKLALVKYLQNTANEPIIKQCLEGKFIESASFLAFINGLTSMRKKYPDYDDTSVMACYYSTAKVNFEKILKDMKS